MDVSRLGSTTRDPETDKEKQTHQQLQVHSGDTKVWRVGWGGGGVDGCVCVGMWVGGHEWAGAPTRDVPAPHYM